MSNEVITPAIFDVAEYLNTYCTGKNYPAVELDFLNDRGSSIAVVQSSSPVIDKEYINGTKIYHLEFEVLIQGAVKDKLNLKRYLTDICLMFSSLKNTSLSASRTVLNGTSTAPSIRLLNDNGMVQLGISVVLTYKE